MSIVTLASVVLGALSGSLLASLGAAGGKVLLFDTSDFSNAASAVAIFPGLAQRCYTLECHRDGRLAIEWEGTQKESLIVFYRDLDCTGVSVQGRGPNGKLALAGTKMNYQVASFMIMESGMYPTRGLFDVCLTEFAVFENNTLGVSEVGEEVSS